MNGVRSLCGQLSPAVVSMRVVLGFLFGIAGKGCFDETEFGSLCCMAVQDCFRKA